MRGDVPAADEILIARSIQDFEDGFAHTRARIRATHNMLAGAALDAIVVGTVKALHVRERMGEDTRALLALAHRVAAGEDASTLAEAHLDEVLRLKQKMHLIAREDDPGFQEIKAILQGLFARRLPDLARMATVDAPADYADLVRKAFPDRAEVDAIVDDNARTIESMLTHLETHPHVLRLPASMAPKLAALARDFLSWKVQDVRGGVAEIYGDTKPE